MSKKPLYWYELLLQNKSPSLHFGHLNVRILETILGMNRRVLNKIQSYQNREVKMELYKLSFR